MLSKKMNIAIFLVGVIFLVGIAIFISIDRNNKQQELSSAKNEEEVSAPKTETLQQGSGDRVVKAGDIIDVNYVGTLQNGQTFDSNISSDKPFEFKIGAGEVIEGWDEGLIGMKVGEKRRLVISPDKAYGDQAKQGIPANSTLIFDVVLLKIK
jgi:FKBP-type peptidyl-prolyl cis-trans isomerase